MKLIEWLSCKEELKKVFTTKEIEEAIKTSGLTLKDLTTIENFAYEPFGKKEIIAEYHRGQIKVCKTIKIDGEYVSMEGQKNADVRTYRIIDHYQGLRHEKLIRALLEKRFKWFKNFKWSIYEVSGKIEHYEIYLNTGKKSLYVPLVALLNRNKEAIIERNKSYLTWYKMETSYDLNHKEGESLKAFKERKGGELEEELKVLETPTTKKFFGVLINA